ncbi:MAG: HAD family hydrolase [Propioniciclava sp.]|uniref:Cof-type HAD-IIB family hydrolase n=1 Tax=Propioniciclava sp. TaxID=2038686 RepID=UPI0039E429E3
MTGRRAIFIDVDGTLIGRDGRVPGSARDAIREARARGHLAFLCTGRSGAKLWDEVTEVGFDGMVAASGAYAEVGGVELFHRSMSAEQIDRAADFFDAHGVDYGFEGLTGVFGTRAFRDQLESKVHEQYPDAVRLAEMRRGILSFLNRIDIDPRPRREVSMARFMFEGGITFDEIRAELTGFRVVASSMPYYGYHSGELLMPDVHKATAMQVVLAHLGLSSAVAVALGDSDNDLEMLAYAGLGIAMGNAPQHVKDAADEVTASVGEDGLRLALARHGLIS